MSHQEILQRIRDCIVNLNDEEALENVKKALENKITPKEIISSGLVSGMEIVGEKFEKGEYFISELIIAGEIGKQILKLLDPYLKGEKIKPKTIGKVVIGTVKGDIHDIGKNVVAMLLEIAGFEVIDLGVDVPPEKFVDAVKKNQADIVAMSALLTVTMPEMRNVIEELKRAGLRDRVKVIVGGASVTEEYAKSIGADGYGETAYDGVKICREWVS